MPYRHSIYRGFTLMELLITLGIIALLIAVLLPAVSLARDSAKVSLCLANQRQLGLAVAMYANEHKREIPTGPSDSDDYTLGPSSGHKWSDTTSNAIWIFNETASKSRRERNAFGMVLSDSLVPDPKVAYCPGDDLPGDSIEERKKFANPDSMSNPDTSLDAYSGYFYRQLHGLTRGFTGSVRNNIDELGYTEAAPNYPAGLKFQAMGWDRQSLITAGGATPRINHKNNTVNIVYFDGHAKNYPNYLDRMGLTDANVAAAGSVYARLGRMAINADAVSEKNSMQGSDLPYP